MAEAGSPFTVTAPLLMSAAARRREPAPPDTSRLTSGAAPFPFEISLIAGVG